MHKLLESFWIKFAWLMPKSLVYWCTIRLLTYKCECNPTDQSIPDAMKRFVNG